VALLRFPVRVKDKQAALERAAKRHLELGDWFVQPMHSQMLPYECLGYTRGLCPEAEKAAEQIVNLPTHDRVSDRHARKLIEFLRAECRPAHCPSE
jgi:dTDP-4-amino-4,6-dideoxygalactose transaminase